MVSSTRSGRVLNGEGTRSLRSRSVGVEVKSGSSRSRTANGNFKDAKSLSPTDSAPAESSKVRRSAGEPSVKKLKTPSPTVTRKSPRLKSASPNMHPTKLGFTDGGLLTKKKRLTARDYRSDLNRQAKKAKNSDTGMTLSEIMRECRGEHSSKMREEVSGGDSTSEGFEDVTEGPDSSSRHLADLVLPCDTAADIDSKDADIDSDIAVTLVNDKNYVQEHSITNTTSSSYSERETKNLDQCVLCSGPQRVQNATHAKEHCSCATVTECDVSVSHSKDMRKLEVTNCVRMAEHHNSASAEDLALAIQADVDPNACAVCKHPGVLLFCNGKGCKRSYHLSCLDPPLKDFPHGVWLCLSCVKKKLELGVYSVSEGWESIWSIREGIQTGKEYFVKYKGLSHVHNRWIPESQILIEAPSLLAQFTKPDVKDKVKKWKHEWTEPQRLLQKRVLMPRKLADESSSPCGHNLSRCDCEWLVKWKGLGYEHASWELEDSPFLCSSEAMMLIKEYEERHNKAKQASDPSIPDKALHVKNSPFHKLSKLPNGFPLGLDNDHFYCINRIREYWHKSQNAVLIDDQERIKKSILFILSLQSCTCLPFLIVTDINSLSLWETEFIRLTRSINVVVYSGDKSIRSMIRTVEFYDEGGCIMFQVLLTHLEAIVEDLDALDCIGWESMIFDECQNSRMFEYFESFNKLQSCFRLLVLSGQLKDSLAEYINLLSFLDSGGKETYISSLMSDSNDNVGMLAIVKEKLARYVAYERKPDSSKFLEYWVPVWLSNVQLEQYCATLISNSIALRSCSKVDHVGALRDIVISTRKCCDHPYLVDQSLQGSLTKGLPAVEYLNVGVNASGKLQLLDKIIQEIRNQGLRVLILFQSIGGTGRNKIGEFLEDFLHQRFGAESYERVDSGLIMSKKSSALNKFNDKAMGRFVFLIENRACLPSIKLSSVDAIIIYDSDWNPLNDLKALQKISIESQFGRVKVFRLYTCYTVEEKVLSFAKQDLILDSNLQNISPNVSHSLLSWGASYLFSKLDECHQNDNPTIGSDFSTVNLSLNDVVQELVKQIQNNDPVSSSSILIKALQSGTSYSRNILLIGEKEGITSLDSDPPSFWSNLVEGRYPQWRFIPSSPQRTRRRLPYSDESLKVADVDNDESKRKRRRVDNGTVDPFSLQSWLHDKRKESGGSKDVNVPGCSTPCTFNQLSLISHGKTTLLPSWVSEEPEASNPHGSSGSQCLPNSVGIMHNIRENSPVSPCNAGTHISHGVECEKWDTLLNAQSNLHLLLKPELSELCETLRLPDNVKDMSEKFLDYIMKNHHVNQEQETILQAFKISLCWRAAAFLKHEHDHKETLALAKRCLKFECTEEQAESVYSKLRFLKKKFSRQTGALKNDIERHSLEKSSCMQSNEDVATSLIKGNVSQSSAADHKAPEDRELRGFPDSKMCFGQLNLEQEKAPLVKISVKPAQKVSLMEMDLHNQSDMIKKICSDRLNKLLEKQRLECEEFNQEKARQKKKLQSTFDHALDLIHALELDSVARDDKINQLNQEFSKKFLKFEDYMRSQRTRLAVMHVKARDKERHLKEKWLNEAKTATLSDSFHEVPLSDSGFRLGEYSVHEQVGTSDCARGTLLSSCSSDHQCDNLRTVTPVDSIESGQQSAEIPAVLPNGAEEDIPIEANSPVSNLSGMDVVQTVELIPASVPQGGVGNMLMESEFSDSRLSAPNSVHNIAEGIVNTVTEDIIDVENHVNADNPHGAGLISSTQQNQTEFPSSFPTSTISGHGNFTLPTQQPPRGTSGDLESSDVSESRSHLPQLSAMATWIPPQGLHLNPFENELARLRKQDDTCDKMHEEKKLQLKSEYDQEIEKIRKKYEGLVQNAETEYLDEKKRLGTICSKIVINRNLADEFRARFVDHKGGNSATSQGPRSSSMQQSLGASQPQPTQCSVTVTTTLPPAPNLASFPSARLRAPAPALPSISSTQLAPQAHGVFPSNPTRHHSSPLLPPRTSFQAGIEPRAPAPHLQRFRSQMSVPAQNFPPQPGSILNQQQSLAQRGSSSSVQVSPVLPSCTSNASASGFSQPEASVTLPSPQCTSTFCTTADLTASVRCSNNEADILTMSALGDIAPAFEQWLAHNPESAGSVRPSGSSTGAAVDVICLDDD